MQLFARKENDAGMKLSEQEPATKETLRRLAASAFVELNSNILPFWQALEDPAGGHWISVNHRGRIDRTAPRTLVFAARLCWTFSEAARRFSASAYRPAAERAFLYLLRFRDLGDSGGYFAALSPDGAPHDRSKHVYGQAFVIYALAAHAQLVRDENIQTRALELFRTIEDRTRCPKTGLYLESFDELWRETPNSRQGAWRGGGAAYSGHPSASH